MRKLLSLFLSACVLVSATAQKISIKKNKIKSDDAEIAKIESKGGGFFRAYKGTISSLSDTALISIEEKSYDFRNPLLGSISYTDLQFLPLNKTLRVKLKESGFSDKKAVELLFGKESAAVLSANMLNEAAIDQLIGSKQYDFSKDSTESIALWNEVSKPLSVLPQRDMTQPVQLKALENDGSGWATFDIYQGNVALGKIRKLFTPSPNPAQFQPSCQYAVEKAAEKPFSYNNRNYNTIPVAQLSLSEANLHPSLVAYRDGKSLGNPVTNIAAGEKAVAELLVKSGYL